MKREAVVIDTMALKAVLEPMLIRARRSEVIVQTRIEYKGSADDSWTCV